MRPTAGSCVRACVYHFNFLDSSVMQVHHRRPRDKKEQIRSEVIWTSLCINDETALKPPVWPQACSPICIFSLLNLSLFSLSLSNLPPPSYTRKSYITHNFRALFSSWLVRTSFIKRQVLKDPLTLPNRCVPEKFASVL